MAKKKSVSKTDNKTDRRLQNLRPPWKKGQSGNPQGRPKGTALTDILLKELDKVCPEDKQKRTWKEMIVLATMKLAMRGNTAALKEVWERTDGKVILPIEQVGDITIQISKQFKPKPTQEKSE